MKLSMMLVISFLASASAFAQSVPKALHCQEADLNASPYTTVQIHRIGGGQVEMAYLTSAFFGSEEMMLPVYEDLLSAKQSSTVTSEKETPKSAGGFYIEWGGGDGAVVDVSRPKKTVGTGAKKKIIKGTNYAGTITFPNGVGPKHLHDGGQVKVNCQPAKYLWKK